MKIFHKKKIFQQKGNEKHETKTKFRKPENILEKCKYFTNRKTCGQGSTQSEVRLSHLFLPLGQLGHRHHGGLQSVPDRVRLHLLSFTVIIDYGWDHYFTEASAYLGI